MEGPRSLVNSGPKGLTVDTMRNPAVWMVDQLIHAARHVMLAGRSVRGTEAGARARRLPVRRIDVADLKDVLANGLADFGAYRTDVFFLGIIYPVIGLVLARAAFGYDMLPLLFPIASGFALVGPVAAVGLYEMSRRREQGIEASWIDAFAMVRLPSFGAILALGLVLLAIFLFWLAAAHVIYANTLGPESPASVAEFVRDIFTTGPGWTMIVVGVGVGFLFAALVLVVSVVSFPLLLDRDVGLGTAVSTSVRAVIANPRPMAVWGMIVAGGLAIGSIPLFLGLIVVMPVLGHTTWHLYRKVVPR